MGDLVEMTFNREQLQGIFLSIGRPELTIYRNERKDVGYEIRIRINVRADNYEFLLSIHRGLNVNGIDSKFKERESNIRPKPILWVSGIINIRALCNMMPKDAPSIKSKWDSFSEAADLIYMGEHSKQEGLDKLLRLKGEI